jgi:hypothetical protein
VLDFPSRDGLPIQAIRADYEPVGFTPGTHRRPAGTCACVGESFDAPLGALHSVSRNAGGDVPASLSAFFVLGDGERATPHDRV